MAEITAKITGHSIWDSSYAVYKIEITAKEKWVIYRRFSAFEQLHAGLQRELGQHYMDLHLTLPDKDYQGSYLASRTSIVQYRTPLLQKYLDDLIQHKVPSVKIKNFLDFETKGASGIKQALGANVILKEGFLRVSHGLLTKIMWHNWRTNYIVLTRNGTLYLLKNMYDSPTEAVVRYDLTSGGVHINGDLSSFSVAITSTATNDVRYLKSPSADEFAFWLRSIGEFGSKGTSSNFSAAKSTNKAGTTQQVAEAPAPIADRQGTKTDELSAMYGI